MMLPRLVRFFLSTSAVLALQPLPSTPPTRSASSARCAVHASLTSAPLVERRELLRAAVGAASSLLLLPTRAARAAEDGVVSDAQYGYRLTTPPGWKESPKPVKTHLHELLLSATQGAGKQKLGVTVDPVKINSLEEFGTLDVVTKQVLGVEEKRDGVTSVTLRANSAEAGDAEEGRPSYYTIEYATVSSRGTKIFCCKYCITKGKLYVLQAQASLDAFDGDESVRQALRDIVSSFQVRAA